jgi:hypothetical protein
MYGETMLVKVAIMISKISLTASSSAGWLIEVGRQCVKAGTKRRGLIEIHVLYRVARFVSRATCTTKETARFHDTRT